MATLTKPVSISDIQDALGVSSSVNKLGQLCTDSNINMWSKYKPIKYSSKTIMSQYDSTNNNWNSNSTWWRGYDGKCGFTPYSSNTLSDIISNTTGGMNGWSYTGTPTGSTYPYRQADFIGYNPDAVPMLSSFQCNSEIKANGNFYASCIIPLPDDNITMGDIIVNGNSLYFGVVITNSSGTILKQVTNNTAGVAGVSFTFPSSIGVGNGYKCYPFLATNPIELDGNIGNNTYYTCPNLNYQTFNVVSSYINMSIRASYISNTSAYATVKNLDTYDHTITVSIRFASSNYYNSIVTGEEQKSSTTVTYSGLNQTKMFNFDNLTSGASYKIYVLIDGVELRSVNILQQLPDEPETL